VTSTTLSDAMIFLGFADGYDDLVEIVRSRVVELNLSQERVNELRGFYGGYLQKVLCGLKRLGGMSSAALLGALGLRMAIVVDPVMAEKMRHR
jgi:hypothetical protein